MKYLSISLLFLLSLSYSCSTEEITEHERTNVAFLDSLGGDISNTQWWRTAVTLNIDVTTDNPVTLMLISINGYQRVLYDYKEVASSGIVTMTAPQGQANSLYLRYICKGKQKTQSIQLTGKMVENVYLNTITSTTTQRARRVDSPPASLSGKSINGDAKYYQFTTQELGDFFAWMATNTERVNAKDVEGQICNYELESNGPFYITWVTGNESLQTPHILGYYYHSPTTYDDIVYEDLSETHKWDYIDGLAKVQYQISKEERIVGQDFYPNTWYDANFDMSDIYGATKCYNMDRVGDNAYNMHTVYYHYRTGISALRGISFKIDVPEGKRIGFFLRSDTEPLPDQWTLLKSKGVPPYVPYQEDFMGACFCAEFMNVKGNGGGFHRSFIKDYGEIYWMGMEDILDGGDHDCNDIIFGVVSDLKIQMPTIVDPTLLPPDDLIIEDFDPFPWTIAYEDVNRNPDFDFNDAVIKLEPDFKNELCCVTVMAAGSDARMYLHYDGPDGDVNMGEIHELLKGKSNSYINTKGALANTPFVQVDCVPWPKDYTMANDAKRFYIEIQRGSCDDCTDVITLAQEPGNMPEAILVAGEWQWPKEGVHIKDAYGNFPGWAKDVTKTQIWDWYKSAANNSSVSY